jgi:hypothetical protein
MDKLIKDCKNWFLADHKRLIDKSWYLSDLDNNVVILVKEYPDQLSKLEYAINNVISFKISLSIYKRTISEGHSYKSYTMLKVSSPRTKYDKYVNHSLGSKITQNDIGRYVKRCKPFWNDSLNEDYILMLPGEFGKIVDITNNSIKIYIKKYTHTLPLDNGYVFLN